MNPLPHAYHDAGIPTCGAHGAERVDHACDESTPRSPSLHLPAQVLRAHVERGAPARVNEEKENEA